jgi:hypothetical protein
VVSDKEGRIYVGVGFYNRVQVYDDDGDYLFGFFIDCHGGAFVLEVDSDDRLHVFTARGSMHHVYDRRGNLVKTTKDLPRDVYKRHARSRHRRFDAAGRRYAIRRPLWDPTIERVMPSGRVLLRIRTPFWLFPCIFPVPCFAVCLIGSVAHECAKRRRERDRGADRDRDIVTHSSREKERQPEPTVRVISWLDELVNYGQATQIEYMCPLDESVQRLQCAVKTARSSREGLRGIVSQNHVCLYWRTASLRTMRPYFVGRFCSEGEVTVLKGRFVSNVVLRIFMSVWFAGVLTGIVMALLLPFFDANWHPGLHLAGIFLLTGMLLASAWMVHHKKAACSDHVQNIIDALKDALQTDPDGTSQETPQSRHDETH